MWILIIWMFGAHSGNDNPNLAVQEFSSQQACKNAFAEVKRLNDGEVGLRGVCTPKDYKLEAK